MRKSFVLVALCLTVAIHDDVTTAQQTEASFPAQARSARTDDRSHVSMRGSIDSGSGREPQSRLFVWLLEGRGDRVALPVMDMPPDGRVLSLPSAGSFCARESVRYGAGQLFGLPAASVPRDFLMVSGWPSPAGIGPSVSVRFS